MIHIMVVDDEPPIADGLVDLLREACDGLVTAKAFYSASAAARHLGSHPVDLVVADINMPGLTGLELAADLREHYPLVKVILLTGYSRFDYIYEANQLGGVQYLLKTTDDATIVLSVRRAIDEIEIERRKTHRTDQLESLAKRLEPIAERGFIDRIIRDDVSESVGTQADMDAIGVPLDAARPVLALVASGAGIDADGLNRRLRTLISAALGPQVSAVIGEVDAWVGVGVALLQPAPVADYDYRGLHADWIGALEHEHRGFARADGRAQALNIVVNESFVSFGTVGSAVKRLLSLCGFLYQGTGSVYTPEGAMRARLDEGRSIRGLSAQAIARMESAFDSMEWDRYFTEVERLLTAAEQASSQSVWAQYQSRLGLSFVCSTIIDKLPRSPATLQEEARFIMVSESELSLAELANEYRSIFSELARLRGQDQDDAHYSHPVQLSLAYIREQLHADLSVTSIADHLSLSSGHLSRVFKAETGQTLLDYISDLRLERAKALLMNTNMRVQDIAGQVGLTSIDYFIRFFKRRTGMPPQQFRDANHRA